MLAGQVLEPAHQRRDAAVADRYFAPRAALGAIGKAQRAAGRAGMALAQGRRTETPVGERIFLVADAQRGEVEQADDRGDDALGAEGAAGEIVFQTRAEQRQRVAEGGARPEEHTSELQSLMR